MGKIFLKNPNNYTKIWFIDGDKNNYYYKNLVYVSNKDYDDLMYSRKTIDDIEKSIMNIQTKPEVRHMRFIRAYTIDATKEINIQITMIVTMEQLYVRNGKIIRNYLLTGI